MNAHLLMYKHVRRETPYEKYIKEKQEAEKAKERAKIFAEILKFNESRYPRELMDQLNREINPFELSVDKLKEVYNSKFPQYSNELVHEAVEYVFKRKCEQSETIIQNAMVIEDGNESIRNGRKLQKEDFSYFFNPLDTDKRKQDFSSSKNDLTKRQKDTSRSKFEDIHAKTERFNEMLMEAINNEKNRFQNIQLINEGDAKDSLHYQAPTSRREASESFPKFREGDLIVKPEGGLETGRTELQELNFLLGALTKRDEDDFDSMTGRSRGSNGAVKISKQVYDNLYNARGKLKLDLVKRVVNKFKRENA